MLVTPSTAFVWSGASCLPEEASAANMALAVITAGGSMRETESVKEGEEPEAFWAALGGKGALRCTARLVSLRAHHDSIRSHPSHAAVLLICCAFPDSCAPAGVR